MENFKTLLPLIHDVATAYSEHLETPYSQESKIFYKQNIGFLFDEATKFNIRSKVYLQLCSIIEPSITNELFGVLDEDISNMSEVECKNVLENQTKRPIVFHLDKKLIAPKNLAHIHANKNADVIELSQIDIDGVEAVGIDCVCGRFVVDSCKRTEKDFVIQIAGYTLPIISLEYTDGSVVDINFINKHENTVDVFDIYACLHKSNLYDKKFSLSLHSLDIISWSEIEAFVNKLCFKYPNLQSVTFYDLPFFDDEYIRYLKTPEDDGEYVDVEDCNGLYLFNEFDIPVYVSNAKKMCNHISLEV